MDSSIVCPCRASVASRRRFRTSGRLSQTLTGGIPSPVDVPAVQGVAGGGDAAGDYLERVQQFVSDCSGEPFQLLVLPVKFAPTPLALGHVVHTSIRPISTGPVNSRCADEANSATPHRVSVEIWSSVYRLVTAGNTVSRFCPRLPDSAGTTRVPAFTTRCGRDRRDTPRHHRRRRSTVQRDRFVVHEEGHRTRSGHAERSWLILEEETLTSRRIGEHRVAAEFARRERAERREVGFEEAEYREGGQVTTRVECP